MSAITPIAGNAGHFQLVGDLSFTTVPQVYLETDTLFGSPEAALVLDLSRVGRTDSAGLALLVEWLRQARRLHKNMHFRAIPEQLLAIAEASGVEAVLPLSNHEAHTPSA